MQCLVGSTGSGGGAKDEGLNVCLLLRLQDRTRVLLVELVEVGVQRRDHLHQRLALRVIAQEVQRVEEHLQDPLQVRQHRRIEWFFPQVFVVVLQVGAGGERGQIVDKFVDLGLKLRPDRARCRCAHGHHCARAALNTHAKQTVESGRDNPVVVPGDAVDKR